MVTSPCEWNIQSLSGHQTVNNQSICPQYTSSALYLSETPLFPVHKWGYIYPELLWPYILSGAPLFSVHRYICPELPCPRYICPEVLWLYILSETPLSPVHRYGYIFPKLLCPLVHSCLYLCQELLYPQYVSAAISIRNSSIPQV
jgi:hypothetical protein